ncbi:MAG: AMP-binding protein, partial [Bacteroidota bacterium]
MSQGIPQAVLKVDNFVDVLREQAVLNDGKRLYGFLTNGETLGESYTFDELDARARSIAVRLQERNLEGERAILLYPSSLEYLAAFFGCLYAGVIAVPVYPPQMGKQLSRIDSIIKDCQPKVFMATADIFQGIENNMPALMEAGAGKWMLTDTGDEPSASLWKRPNVNGDTISFLQYTSGSTGTPKGVMVSHSNLLANQRSLSKLTQSHPDSVYVSWLPLFHDMGLIGTALQPVFYGFASYQMAPFSFVQRPIRWLKAIADYGATFSVSPNFGYDLCVSRISDEEAANLDLSSWEMACNGAEPVRIETLNQFSRKFAVSGFK